jgi:hypothetical protein
MTTEVDFERHLRVRDRIRSTLEALKAEDLCNKFRFLSGVFF